MDPRSVTHAPEAESRGGGEELERKSPQSGVIRSVKDLVGGVPVKRTWGRRLERKVRRG